MSQSRGGSAIRQERYPLYLGYESDLVEGIEHFECFHKEAHGTVLVWEALKDDKRWTKLRPEDPMIPVFLKGLQGQRDTFLSVNEFDGWRLVRLLRSLRALYVDLDGVNHLQEVFDLLFEKRLPNPSLVIFSGQGMHLYWLLEPMGPKVLPVWQKMQDVLVRALGELGADPKARDCTRVLRLVGTVNSKNSEVVRGLVLTGERWKLHELANEILGYREPRKKGQVRDLRAQAAKKGRETPRKIAGSIYERWYRVYQDLNRIAEYHGGIPEGHRDEWLFLAGVSLSWFTTAEALQDEIEDAARTFTKGLQEGEVAKVAKLLQRKAEAASRGEKIEYQGEQVDPRYRFRRSSLYKRLKGIIPDGLLLKLRAVIPDRLAMERKRERDRARWQDHNTGEGVRLGNEDKKASARLMKAQGNSMRFIARQLGVDPKTIRRWCRD